MPASLTAASTKLALKLAAPAFARSEPVEGMRLDPAVAAALAARARRGEVRLEELSPEEARAEYKRQAQSFRARPRRMRAVSDRRLSGPAGPIPVRIYNPLGAERKGPLCVYYHGGGGVIGDLDSADNTCRFLADEANVAVASVGYRLAPEHPFPAGLDDAFAAYRQLAEQAADFGADPQRLAVAGDSLGANFAANIAREFVGDPRAPRFQLLIYPGVDLTASYPSHATFAEGYLLTKPLMDWFLAHYLPEPGLGTDPRASPLFAELEANMPPALVATAGFDPIRDEGRAYADRLEAAGIPVRYECFEGLIHGFVSVVDLIDAATHATRACARALAAHLRSPDLAATARAEA